MSFEAAPNGQQERMKNCSRAPRWALRQHQRKWVPSSTRVFRRRKRNERWLAPLFVQAITQQSESTGWRRLAPPPPHVGAGGQKCRRLSPPQGVAFVGQVREEIWGKGRGEKKKNWRKGHEYSLEMKPGKKRSLQGQARKGIRRWQLNV